MERSFSSCGYIFSAGTRSACINAATLALADAGIPMQDLVTSCSAGYLNNTPLLGKFLTSVIWTCSFSFQQWLRYVIEANVYPWKQI